MDQERWVTAAAPPRAARAHALKNCLSVVRAVNQLLEHEVGEKGQQRLKRSEEAIRRMLALLHEDLAPPRGANASTAAFVPASRVMQSVSERVADRAATARVELIVDCGRGGVYGEEAALVEAVENLVANAIEASSDGGVVILTTRKVADGSQSWIITDSGRGMPDELIGRIGMPFATSREGGSGLGIAVARGIIARHGGTIRLESSTSSGTTASIWLPASARVHEAGLARAGDGGAFELVSDVSSAGTGSEIRPQAVDVRSRGPSTLNEASEEARTTNTITMKDGTNIFFKDWGSGQPLVFHHGWPLSADDWDIQMMFFLQRGYRVIAHDRRGHGRSTQTVTGNDMDTYASDVDELVSALGLRDAVHIGHSTGGGEVARYVARYGQGRVAKAVLISSVPPLMLKTAENPGGLAMEVFDGYRRQVATNRSQFFREVPVPFYGFNRTDAAMVEGIRDNWWRQAMMGGVKAHYDCIKAFSETDFSEDLRSLNVPVLLMHGDDDQIVPFSASSQLGIKLLKKGAMKVYPGYPHGMFVTHADIINDDLLAFVQA